jgi:hypothetical protein
LFDSGTGRTILWSYREAARSAVRSRVIAAGPANDLVFSIAFHFTINANGEVVVFHNTVTQEACV